MKVILIIIIVLFCANLGVNVYKIRRDHERHIQQIQAAHEMNKRYCETIKQLVDVYRETLNQNKK